MKRELIYYSILTLVIAALLFFETDFFAFNKQSSTRVIEMEAFEKLNIDLECNIYVSLGEEQKVVFEGPELLVSRLETKMKNGVLTITERSPGFFARLFHIQPQERNELNVYVKLTATNQLIAPRKGNLISNETSLYFELERCTRTELYEFRYLLQISGASSGVFSFNPPVQSHVSGGA